MEFAQQKHVEKTPMSVVSRQNIHRLNAQRNLLQNTRAPPCGTPEQLDGGHCLIYYCVFNIDRADIISDWPKQNTNDR